MKNILHLCLSVLLAAGMLFADSGGSVNWVSGDPALDMPAVQFTGWFFNPTEDPFPSLADPSLQWTSQSNIDQIDQWLRVIAEFEGEEPAAQLTGSLELNQSQSPNTVPEPGTFLLLIAGLAFLGLPLRLRVCVEAFIDSAPIPVSPSPVSPRPAPDCAPAYK